MQEMQYFRSQRAISEELLVPAISADKAEEEFLEPEKNGAGGMEKGQEGGCSPLSNTFPSYFDH